MTTPDDVETALRRFRPVGPPASMMLPVGDPDARPLRTRRRAFVLWGSAATLVAAGVGGGLLWASRTASERPAVAPGASVARAPGEPVSVGGDIAAPELTYHVEPEYLLDPGPGIAAILRLTVETNGLVRQVEVLRAPLGPGPAEAAVEAARQWEYEPVVVDQEAVPFLITVVVYTPGTETGRR